MARTNPHPDPELSRVARRLVTEYRWGEQNVTRTVYLPRALRAVERGAAHLSPDERARLHSALARSASSPHAEHPSPGSLDIRPGDLSRWGAQTMQRIQNLATYVRAVERSCWFLDAGERARLLAALGVTEPAPTRKQEKENTT